MGFTWQIFYGFVIPKNMLTMILWLNDDFIKNGKLHVQNFVSFRLLKIILYLTLKVV